MQEVVASDKRRVPRTEKYARGRVDSVLWDEGQVVRGVWHTFLARKYAHTSQVETVTSGVVAPGSPGRGWYES